MTDLLQQISTNCIRNTGVISCLDAGKSTFFEKIQNYEIPPNPPAEWMHSVGHYNPPPEPVLETFHWNRGDTKQKFNFINIHYGSYDDIAELKRNYRAVDGIIGFFDSVNCPAYQIKTAWSLAEKNNIPRMVFINKLDRAEGDFFKRLDDLKKISKAEILPLIIPVNEGTEFSTVIDILEQKTYSFDGDWKSGHENCKQLPIPDDLKGIAQKAYDTVCQTVSNYSDEILQDLLDGKNPGKETLRKKLREYVSRGKIVPVLCGSLCKNIGFQHLLNAAADFFPSPADAREFTGDTNVTGKEENCSCNDTAPFSAYIFTKAADSYSGKLFFFKIRSGIASKNMTVYNPRNKLTVKIPKMIQVCSNDNIEQEKLSAGDIAAAVGLKDVWIGDILCDTRYPICPEQSDEPEPIAAVEIKPAGAQDRKKLSDCTGSLGMRLFENRKTGETLLIGTGINQLHDAVSSLKNEFRINFNVEPPDVFYRERLLKNITLDLPVSSGKSHCFLEISPEEQVSEITVRSKMKTDAFPLKFLKALEDGIRESAESGILSGYPLCDFNVNIINGHIHPDSTEKDFKKAGLQLIAEAADMAGVMILEPVMEVEIITPEEYLGDIISEITNRNGTAEEIDNSNADRAVILAKIPFSMLFDFESKLREISKAHGIFNMKHSHFKEVSKDTGRKLLEKIRV